jgi:hypothetical protein
LLRASERAAEQTEEVLRQAEGTVREAELRTIVYGSLGTTDYDGLSVEEVAKRLEGLSTDELEKFSRVREEEQEPRDPHREDQLQDKGQLLKQPRCKVVLQGPGRTSRPFRVFLEVIERRRPAMEIAVLAKDYEDEVQALEDQAKALERRSSGSGLLQVAVSGLVRRSRVVASAPLSRYSVGHNRTAQGQ